MVNSGDVVSSGEIVIRSNTLDIRGPLLQDMWQRQASERSGLSSFVFSSSADVHDITFYTLVHNSHKWLLGEKLICPPAKYAICYWFLKCCFKQCSIMTWLWFRRCDFSKNSAILFPCFMKGWSNLSSLLLCTFCTFTCFSPLYFDSHCSLPQPRHCGNIYGQKSARQYEFDNYHLWALKWWQFSSSGILLELSQVMSNSLKFLILLNLLSTR